MARLKKVIELVELNVQPVFDAYVVRAFYSIRTVSQQAQSTHEEDEELEAEVRNVEYGLEQLGNHPQTLRDIAEQLV